MLGELSKFIVIHPQIARKFLILASVCFMKKKRVCLSETQKHSWSKKAFLSLENEPQFVWHSLV